MKEHLVVENLKEILKAKGIGHQQVAERLGVSLATVKRDFTLKKLSLNRLLKICDLFNLPPGKLFDFDEANKRKVHQLTLEEEQYFSKNLRCWGLYDMLLGNRTIPYLKKEYNISEQEMAKYLKKLETFKLIEWHPGDKVKVLVWSVSWRKNGPLQNILLKEEEKQFLSDKFQKKNQFCSFFVDEIPEKSIEKVIVELKKVEDLIELESNLLGYGEEESNTVGVMLAIRPWNYNAFSKG